MSSAQVHPVLDAALIATMSDPSAFDGGTFLAGREYRVVSFVAHGETGFVWRVENQYGRERAAKFTPIEFVANGDVTREFQLRQSLPSPLFTRAEDVAEWTHQPSGQTFMVIVEEWVPGAQTLESFIRTAGDTIDVRTIVEFTRHFASAMEALEAKDLAHDDLHARNIMVRPSDPGEAGYASSVPTLQLVMVDTGSLKPLTATRKSWSDYHHIAHHLAHMHNQVHSRRNLTPTDRAFLAELKSFIPYLTEEDANRAVRTGAALRDWVDEAYTRAEFGVDENTRELNNPFEFISAEQISSDGLLLDLFARTTWLEQATSNDPLLLTGPRGCGKSMVLRYMSLRAHAERGDTHVPLDVLNVAGIYVSCTADFQNRFAEFQTEERVEAYRAEIIHYFNLVYLRETVATLIAIQARQDSLKVFGLGVSQATAVMDYIAHFVQEPAGATFENTPLRSAASSVERAIFESQQRLHTGAAAPYTLTPLSFLGDLTSLLVKLMPFFGVHRIAFLLDDFSLHRLSEHVQRALLPIVWERRSSHLFKVSSEKHGTVDDFRGGELTIDLARERIEVDCGSEFLTAKRAHNVEFATELLRHRLRAANWVGTPEELIGDSPTLAAVAETLATKGQSGGAYFGMGTIASLCSGDISTLLLVYRHVLASSDKTSRRLVPANQQHEAIVDVSRKMLRVVMHHRPLGKELHGHGEAFGAFARRLLQDGTDNQGKPLQVPRIEVDNESAVEVQLTDQQRALSRELLRRAVFIAIDPGRSRHGMVTTVRWHLRRIYLPVFQAGLGKTEALKTNPVGFATFLDSPRAFLEDYATRRLKTTHAPEPAEQLDIWGQP